MPGMSRKAEYITIRPSRFYNANEDRQLATRFGVDNRVSALSVRAQAMWILGYPDMARLDVDYAIADAREIDQSPSLMYL
jgi:hypothetical protein